MKHVLKEFNLTENEIKVYTSLLELGSALAGKLTEKTGIHRRNVYDSLERLVKKGLVGYVLQNSRKYFRATDPNHFFSLLEKEREELKQKEKKLKAVMPELLLSQKFAQNKQRITVFEGKRGLITILDDVIKTGKENLVLSTSQIQMIKAPLALFHKDRVKAKVKDKILLDQKDAARARKLAQLPYTEVRLLAKEFDSPLAINIYGEKVGMLILTENPIAVLIDDKEVNASFRRYFQFLWEIAQEA